MFKREMENYKIFKKIIGLSAILFLVGSMVFVVFEPMVINAVTDTAIVTATVSQEITISAPSDTSFSASIPGVSGNPGAPVTASLTWNTKTNNSTGYNLKLKASQANALYKDVTYYFEDYTITPTYNWSNPSSGSAKFGFAVDAATSADVVAAFKDATGVCGSGTTDGSCWSGFNGITDINAVNRSTETTSTGEAVTINFKAESNAKLLEEGSYTATITATAALN